MVTSLFSESKFGTFKFGPTVQTRPRFGLAVDWKNQSLFTGENEGKYLQSLTVDRGRKYFISADGTSMEPEETGRLSAVLLDVDRRFDLYNEASPLYGFLGGGKYFRLRVRTPSGNIYRLMAGSIDEPISYFENGIQKARFEGTDGWGYLRSQGNQVTIPLQEDIYADQAISKILEAARYPSIWGSDLGEGIDLRPYFWVDGRSPAQVIHEVAHNELGNVFIAADGKMKFRSRLNQENDTITLSDNDIVLNSLTRMSPAEVIRNVLRVVAVTKTELSVQTVWEIPRRLQVAAGETITDVFAEFEYNGKAVPVKNPITPVITTDYDAFQLEDGTGANYTADISISMYAYSTRAKLEITNNGINTAWVYVKVRGAPIVNANSVTFGFENDASIKQFGPRPFTLSVDQNLNIARQYREILANYLTLAKNYIFVDMIANPDVQFSMELGQIVRGEFTSYGISQSYRVIRLRHEFVDKAGIVTKTRVWLEPYVRLFSGVQIPVQVPFQLGGIA